MQMEIAAVSRPEAESANGFYTWNRPPLHPNPLAKLPVGAVRPGGWLAHQLELMVEGTTGRLAELSAFLKPDNGWFGGEGEGWEEQPYWFRGFHTLAVLTQDKRLLAESERWLEAVLSSQDADGYFGARYHKRVVGKDGTGVCDLWPHMVMLDAVREHHEHTGDPRVVPFMSRFFEFCRGLDEDLFIRLAGKTFGAWKVNVQRARAGDMLPHIYWLYNRTGEKWLLELASRFYRHIGPPNDEWLDHHVVNFTQRFAYPGIYFAQTRDTGHLRQSEYWYAQHMGTWGQQPRGIFGADENIRPGCTDPRQAIETCAMAEFAKSFYILGRLTGDPSYADRCEDVMLNHFPASQTPDLKGLHYLTASNQPQLDRSTNHKYQNEEGRGGKSNMVTYSPHRYRCCQHNVAMGWPWYAQNLWQATADAGLCAWLYGASEVRARAGSAGSEARIACATDYPFKGGAAFTVRAAGAEPFPLYLRVPGWCNGFSLRLNGEPLAVDGKPGTYVRIRRVWSRNDRLEVDMPMSVSLTRWPRTGSVTLDRGPLSYSVKIGERWQRCGGTDAWPEWEVLPTSPWNYGLASNGHAPADSFEVLEKERVPKQPWTVDTAPVEIRGRGRKVPGWTLEAETVQELRPSPVASVEPEEELTFIPLGCARLRMACLPVASDSPDARAWA
ncbi:MAG: glycoside hydrolase family 127 protein [Kiritimatiellae bacterium]|nr:glycoside hydrolase family 127 protein [Kiritimatiellia bacterium]